MSITKEEIKKILAKIKDGDRVLEYIDNLEEQNHECNCGKEGHHHHHCDCGCEDYEDEQEDEWKEIETGYKSELTVNDWEELLKDKEIFKDDTLIVLKRMRHVAAPISMAELADIFGGNGALYYSLEIRAAADKIIRKLNINIDEKDDWTVLLKGWTNTELYDTRIYTLLPELYEALGNTDLSNVPLRENI